MKLARAEIHIKKIRISLKQKKETKRTLIDLTDEIDGLIRSEYSQIAFNDINRITIIHPTKRDGGIMNCFLDCNDNIIVGQDRI